MVRERGRTGQASDPFGARGPYEVRPEELGKTYFDWMENIQPWCVSRQLWWGHQIPAWYGPDGAIFVEKTEEEALEAAIQHYIAHEGPWKAWVEEKLENFQPGDILTRDEDVLDTWFSSALWPFSTLGWPDKTPELKTYYQTDVLVTGFDIIFFWVARMMMMGLHFMNEERSIPFMSTRSFATRTARRCRSRKATSSIRLN